ncbi:MAG: hypothetical protein IKZ33_05285 [Lentisphaeria bacterium]|nr:hypothetical protein [Lentisphaeria bacterium]
MSVILGLNAKLFRGASGTQAKEEMKNVKDLTLNLETGEADVTTRATEGWKASVATLKDASLEFGMLYDPFDPDLDAIQDAFLSNTPLAFFITDGDGTGLDADFSITNFSIEQPLEEAVSVSVTAKPTATTRPPTWVNKA